MIVSNYFQIRRDTTQYGNPYCVVSRYSNARLCEMHLLDSRVEREVFCLN